MKHRARPPLAVIVLLALAFASVAAAPVRAAERRTDPYAIMAPEPWLAPKLKPQPRVRFQGRTYGARTFSARTYGARTYGARVPHARHRYATVPLDLPTLRQPPAPSFVPGVGTVPNLPPAPGVGHETFQDRASRCAFQGSLYGVPQAAMSQYMASCAM